MEAFMSGGIKTLTRMTTDVTFTYSGSGSYSNKINITMPTGYEDKDIDSFCANVVWGSDATLSRSVSKIGGKWWYMEKAGTSYSLLTDITNIAQTGQTLTITYMTGSSVSIYTGIYVGFWNR